MLDKNKCYEHYRKEVLKEGFNINIIRKFVDNVANKISDLRSSDNANDDTINIAFEKSNEAIIDMFRKVHSPTSVYIGIPCVSLTEVNNVLNFKFNKMTLSNIKILNNEKRILNFNDYKVFDKHFQFIIVIDIDSMDNTIKRYDVIDSIKELPETASDIHDFFLIYKKKIFKDNLIGVIDITKSSFDNGIKYPELLDDNHKEQVLDVVNDDNMSDEEVGEKVKEIAADVFETTPEEDINLQLSPDIESFLADLFGDADVVDNTDNSKDGEEPQEIEPEEKNDETDNTIPTDKESNEDGNNDQENPQEIEPNTTEEPEEIKDLPQDSDDTGVSTEVSPESSDDEDEITKMGKDIISNNPPEDLPDDLEAEDDNLPPAVKLIRDQILENFMDDDYPEYQHFNKLVAKVNKTRAEKEHIDKFIDMIDQAIKVIYEATKPKRKKKTDGGVNV